MNVPIISLKIIFGGKQKKEKKISGLIATLSFHQKYSPSLKTQQIYFRPRIHPRPHWGSLRCSPKPLISWGKDIPSPLLIPLDACGVSFSAPTTPRPPPRTTWRRNDATDTNTPHDAIYNHKNACNLITGVWRTKLHVRQIALFTGWTIFNAATITNHLQTVTYWQKNRCQNAELMINENSKTHKVIHKHKTFRRWFSHKRSI